MIKLRRIFALIGLGFVLVLPASAQESSAQDPEYRAASGVCSELTWNGQHISPKCDLMIGGTHPDGKVSFQFVSEENILLLFGTLDGGADGGFFFRSPLPGESTPDGTGIL